MENLVAPFSTLPTTAILDKSDVFQRIHDTLLSHTPDGYFLVDLNGNLRYANQALATLLNTTPKKMLGKNWFSLGFPYALASEIHAKIQQAIETKTTQYLDGTFLDAQGKLLYLHRIYLPILNDQGQVENVAGIIHNITELKEAEQKLKESEERFQLLADTIPSLAWMAKPDGWLFWYNKRWYEYTGTIPEQMEGWGWKSVHNPKTLSKVMEKWQKCLSLGEPFSMVFPLRAADGSYHDFETKALPSKNAQGYVTTWFGTNTRIG